MDNQRTELDGLLLRPFRADHRQAACKAPEQGGSPMVASHLLSQSNSDLFSIRKAQSSEYPLVNTFRVSILSKHDIKARMNGM